MFGFIIITTAFKNIKGKFTKKDMFCSVKINMNNKCAFIKAIIDTGNFLKEPITKTPVIVVEKQVLKDIIPKHILDNLDKIVNGEDIELGEYISRIRLIPFTSLGKENGMLLGIKANEVVVETGERNIVLDNVIIGIYNGVLNKSGKYQSLIGLEVLDNNERSVEDEYIRNIKI